MGNCLGLRSAWVSGQVIFSGCTADTRGQLLTWQCLSRNLIHHGNRELQNVWFASSRSFSDQKLHFKKNA